jgi:hypothetical protein
MAREMTELPVTGTTAGVAKGPARMKVPPPAGKQVKLHEKMK